jgi:transcriptional regulator with XRE-family HTH domain
MVGTLGPAMASSTRSPALDEFGRRVRQRRTELGLTLEQVHDASGVHYVYLSGLERGLRNPSVLTVVKLAGALQVDPGELVSGLTV